MAKHGSSRRSTRPLLQGSLLVVIILVVVVASPDFVASFDFPIPSFDHIHLDPSFDHIPLDPSAKPIGEAAEKAARKATGGDKFTPGIRGAREGFKTYKKAHKLIDRAAEMYKVDITAKASRCDHQGASLPAVRVSLPAPGYQQVLHVVKTVRCLLAGATASDVIGLGWGGDLVPGIVTTFSYSLVLQAPVAWLPRPQQAGSTPLAVMMNSGDPSRSLYLYGVRIIQILVNGRNIMPPASSAPLGGGTGVVTAYLSTTETFTRLERGVYESLKAELARNLYASNNYGFQLASSPAPYPDQLCYVRRGAVRIPSVAIVFEGGAVMQLGVANLLQSVNQLGIDCFSILPTTNPGEPAVLGSLLQSGWTMTIQTGGQVPSGTLTFEAPPAV